MGGISGIACYKAAKGLKEKLASKQKSLDVIEKVDVAERESTKVLIEKYDGEIDFLTDVEDCVVGVVDALAKSREESKDKAKWIDNAGKLFAEYKKEEKKLEKLDAELGKKEAEKKKLESQGPDKNKNKIFKVNKEIADILVKMKKQEAKVEAAFKAASKANANKMKNAGENGAEDGDSTAFRKFYKKVYGGRIMESATVNSIKNMGQIGSFMRGVGDLKTRITEVKELLDQYLNDWAEDAGGVYIMEDGDLAIEELQKLCECVVNFINEINASIQEYMSARHLGAFSKKVKFRKNLLRLLRDMLTIVGKNMENLISLQQQLRDGTRECQD